VGYKNVSAEILEDVEISVFLESEALDYSSLVGESGTFLRNDKLIRWNKDGLPDLFLLEPGEEGVLEFSSMLKTTPPIEDFDNNWNFLKNLAFFEDVACPVVDNSYCYLRLPTMRPIQGGDTRVKAILSCGEQVIGSEYIYRKHALGSEQIDETLSSGVASNLPDMMSADNP
jgi:hypothetical protein